MRSLRARTCRSQEVKCEVRSSHLHPVLDIVRDLHVRRWLRTNFGANFEEGRSHFPQKGVRGQDWQQDAVSPLRSRELRRQSEIPADFLASRCVGPRLGYTQANLP